MRVRRALFQHHAQHLRDHVAGALDRHGVADAHVEFGDVVGVVERGVLHDHAANGDRFELRDGRQGSGAADLDVDVADDRRGLLGRKLVSHGPARVARDEAEALLPVEAIDFVDDAVDVVFELGAREADFVVEREQLFDRAARAPQRVRVRTLRP